MLNCGVRSLLPFLLFLASLLYGANSQAHVPNRTAAERYGDYTFARTNLTLTNGNNAFTIIAQNAYGLAITNTPNSYLPTPISYSYDLNGNLTNDGLRSFSYDFENRLREATFTVMSPQFPETFSRWQCG